MTLDDQIENVEHERAVHGDGKCHLCGSLAWLVTMHRKLPVCIKCANSIEKMAILRMMGDIMEERPGACLNPDRG